MLRRPVVLPLFIQVRRPNGFFLLVKCNRPVASVVARILWGGKFSSRFVERESSIWCRVSELKGCFFSSGHRDLKSFELEVPTGWGMVLIQ